MSNIRPHTQVVRIRTGEQRDLLALELIERETAVLFSPADLPTALAQPLPKGLLAAGIATSLLWVADEPESGPVGFVPCQRHALSLHIREMDVRPSFGRGGIGTALLLRTSEAARDLKLRFITLTTFSHLPWNAPFYARHGFCVKEDLAPFPHLKAALRQEHDMGLRNRVAMIKNAA